MHFMDCLQLRFTEQIMLNVKCYLFIGRDAYMFTEQIMQIVKCYLFIGRDAYMFTVINLNICSL